MARKSTPPPVDLAALLPSWELALRSERHLLARVAATIHDETRTSATDARWVDLRRVSSPRRGEAMTAAVVVMGMIRDEWQT